jgi:hypothetical protein
VILKSRLNILPDALIIAALFTDNVITHPLIHDIKPIQSSLILSSLNKAIANIVIPHPVHSAVTTKLDIVQRVTTNIVTTDMIITDQPPLIWSSLQSPPNQSSLIRPTPITCSGGIANLARHWCGSAVDDTAGNS